MGARWAERIIEPSFLIDDSDAMTANGGDKEDGMNLAGKWFQYDGAICHTERVKVACLQTNFTDRVIAFKTKG